MRILWVTTHRFLPVNSGGSIRTANTLRELQRNHAVTVLSAYRGKRPEPGFDAALVREFPGSRATYLGPSPGLLDTGLAVARNLIPIRSLPRPGAATRNEIDAELRNGRHDIAVFDFLDSTDFLPPKPSIPVVLFEHNVEADLLRDQSKLELRLLKRLRVRTRAAGLASLEREMVRRFDHTIAVSTDDAVRLRKLAGHARVTAVPTGADTRNLNPSPLPPEDAPVAMFTGLMHYPPNVDGVTWFCDEIWPRVLREVPYAKFVIVGRNPSGAVQALASPTVEITGEVPDVGAQLERATVAVVPLRIGSGTRLKVYEAMACGRPVVSTTLGAAGLDVQHGRDLLFADTAAGFAEAVTYLLTDRTAATRLAEGAAATAASQDWTAATRAFERVLERVLASHS